MRLHKIHKIFILLLAGTNTLFSTILLIIITKKRMMLSSARWSVKVLFPVDLILIFPNFQAKKWQNHILLKFLKKQGGKNFFLEKIYRYSPSCPAFLCYQ